MHRAQGFAYQLPDLESNLWITRKVITDERDEPVAALLGRLTSEAYYIESRDNVSPLVRMKRFLMLHNSACEAGRNAGVEDIHCWLPPEVEPTFGPQLLKLGWENFIWKTYAKRLD